MAPADLCDCAMCKQERLAEQFDDSQTVSLIEAADEKGLPVDELDHLDYHLPADHFGPTIPLFEGPTP